MGSKSITMAEKWDPTTTMRTKEVAEKRSRSCPEFGRSYPRPRQPHPRGPRHTPLPTHRTQKSTVKLPFNSTMVCFNSTNARTPVISLLLLSSIYLMLNSSLSLACLILTTNPSEWAATAAECCERGVPRAAFWDPACSGSTLRLPKATPSCCSPGFSAGATSSHSSPLSPNPRGPVGITALSLPLCFFFSFFFLPWERKRKRRTCYTIVVN